ncbi:MAG: Hsp20/alpha crystallin family protein [Desulfococcaceae bacterium]|jgi:HSP20 family protein|nr:Hsp20/alpha crystallin family protein [Desulfococcaceae bacterium]
MDYIKIRFGNDLDKFSSDFERNLEEMFRSIGPRFSCTECSWTPPMDIYETADEIMIIAEIAGVNRDDLDIEINSKAVKITGKRIDMPRLEKATYRLAEIQCGKFERVLFLPSPINTEKVTASYLEGMLQLRLLKLPLEKSHKITVSDQ